MVTHWAHIVHNNTTKNTCCLFDSLFPTFYVRPFLILRGEYSERTGSAPLLQPLCECVCVLGSAGWLLLVIIYNSEVPEQQIESHSHTAYVCTRAPTGVEWRTVWSSFCGKTGSEFVNCVLHVRDVVCVLLCECVSCCGGDKRCRTRKAFEQWLRARVWYS